MDGKKNKISSLENGCMDNTSFSSNHLAPYFHDPISYYWIKSSRALHYFLEWLISPGNTSNYKVKGVVNAISS